MWRLVCSDPPVTVQVGADAPRSLGRSSLGAHVSREQPYEFVSRTQASLSVDDAETLSVTAVGSNPTQVRRANGELSVLPNGTATQLDAGDHIILDRQKKDGSVIFVVHSPAAALPAAPLLELLSVRDADSLVGSDVTSGVKLVLLVEHAADAAHDVAYVWFAWDTLIKYERAAGRSRRGSRPVVASTRLQPRRSGWTSSEWTRASSRGGMSASGSATRRTRGGASLRTRNAWQPLPRADRASYAAL